MQVRQMGRIRESKGGLLGGMATTMVRCGVAGCLTSVGEGCYGGWMRVGATHVQTCAQASVVGGAAGMAKAAVGTTVATAQHLSKPASPCTAQLWL